MIDVPDFLSLGSVVSLRGSKKTLPIIRHALVMQKEDGLKKYYDYSMCLYPEGLIGNSVVYSNYDCIETVHFEEVQDEWKDAL